MPVESFLKLIRGVRQVTSNGDRRVSISWLDQLLEWGWKGKQNNPFFLAVGKTRSSGFHPRDRDINELKSNILQTRFPRHPWRFSNSKIRFVQIYDYLSVLSLKKKNHRLITNLLHWLKKKYIYILDCRIFFIIFSCLSK